MRNGNDSIEAVVRRELIRAVIERIQGTDVPEDMKPQFNLETIPGAVCEVREFLNRPYMNKDEIPLAMDVFVPEVEKDKELPVIVHIHGGALVVGDRRPARAFSHVLASRGYLVFNIEYRNAPRANVSEQLDDLCAGMDAIGRHLIDFEVDFGRVFLTAESAGGYLAIYTAAMKHSERLQRAIGYDPTHMEFRALGITSGMYYTNREDPLGLLLADQFYGSKRTSQEFLELMDPEHPEIVRNLPPLFMVTSRGDFLNNYTLMYHKALKEAGKSTKLVYYGEANLGHTFVTVNPIHPKSIDAIDRMLAWFEEQAATRRKSLTHTKKHGKQLARIDKRMKSREIVEQKSWKFIYELNSCTDKRLDAVALRDNRKSYTYREMFRKWERFAEVYSALSIGESACSRVGMLGTSALEPTFAFYGLNMVGASVSMISPLEFFEPDSFFRVVEQENITDLVISDIFAQHDFITRVLSERERLGLRHIIIMKSPYGGKIGNEALEALSVVNYRMLKQMPGLLFMDDLLRKYSATPIAYATKTIDEAAIILHTSGTTNGIHKPIPHSDLGLNEGAYRVMRSDLAANVGSKDACLLFMDLSSAYAMVDMLHLPLALGAQVASAPMAIMNPKLSKMFSYYGISYALLSPPFLDMFSKEPKRPDLSSVRTPIIGGGYLSASERHRLNGVLKKCGSDARIVNGYGLSEAAGAIIISPADREDDTIGYPLPGVDILIRDEDDDTYHDLSEGPRRGVLYISSPSVSSGRIDDVEYFATEEIDGKSWLNTFDLVDVKEDGSLTYVGRMNKFFVNNDGIRFDAGLVETAISKQPGIMATGLAGEYDKTIHDTVPALYVTCTAKGPAALKTVRDALVEVFVREGNVSNTNLPGQCVICEDIPRTTTGKVDVHQILAGTVKGDRYRVTPVYMDGELTDVHLLPSKDAPGMMSGLPAELDPVKRAQQRRKG